MDNVRLFLFLALAFTGLLLWEAWQEDYGVGADRQAGQRPVGQEQSDSPSAVNGDTPVTSAESDIDELVSGTMLAQPQGESGQTESRLIEVHTDTLNLRIDTRGGTIVKATLQNYPVDVDKPDDKFVLLSRSPKDFFIAQAGLLGKAERAPNLDAVYTAGKQRYLMDEDSDQLDVDLVWRSADGVEVVKRFRFTRGSHAVRVQHIVRNGSDSAWSGRAFRQFKRGEPSEGGNAFMYTYTGGAIYSQEDHYQKYSFDELADGKLSRDVTNGWVAMIQHYFLAAFIPPRDQPEHFYGKRAGDGRYIIGSYTPQVNLAPGASHVFGGQLFIGPKDQDNLAALAKGLDLTVDYGWLAFLAQPMWWVLDWIHDLVGNWGWTIVIFTILIKLVFFYPSAVSYRSMAGMRKLAPRMQALKDRYGDDKQRLQQAMMEMYKKEKINPLAGCLPILIQMPFFIALYWVLLESVELRQAPWILWIEDLSIKDPYFVLPILMGASMLVQQKLNPPPPDPMQAKIMMALPIVFTAMFAFFPAGLVLYWLFNNLLSIAQQWVITRQIEKSGAT